MYCNPRKMRGMSSRDFGSDAIAEGMSAKIRFDNTIDTISTIALFEQIERANPLTKRIKIICDNARYYRSIIDYRLSIIDYRLSIIENWQQGHRNVGDVTAIRTGSIKMSLQCESARRVSRKWPNQAPLRPLMVLYVFGPQIPFFFEAPRTRVARGPGRRAG